MKTILIFEPQSGGHRANFINWLKEAAPECSECRFVFFTAADVGRSTAHQLGSAGRWKKQWLLYRLFKSACRKYKPDQALILELTHLELPLALFGSPVPLSAILFVQYPELPRGLKFFFKHWKTRLLLRRAPVKNLFLLNGEKSCRWLTERFANATRFIPISDPAPEAESDPGFVMRDAYGIAPDRTVFLFFGAISKRKGADVLLEALQRLRPDIARQSAFIFCGEPEDSYKKNFQHVVAEVQDLGGVELHVESTFVPDEQMMALFEQCDVVLMPYTRPEYSSGILALAAKTGTPVLGPTGGLLGRLIKENGLGAVSEISTTALAAALESPVVIRQDLLDRFVSNNTIAGFTRPILDAVCYES